ncbi:MAG: hypothetical protein Fur0020_07370 [Thermodesulfovibrionia bacterium]
MKRVFIFSIVIVIIAFLSYSITLVHRIIKISRARHNGILLVYNHSLLKDYYYILRAYRSVLKEEGIPYDEINVNHLLSLNVEDVTKGKPIIIFPDGVDQILPDEARLWIKDYLQRGGNVAVIYDVGIKDKKGAYLDEAMFADITGINYINYNRLREDAYAVGYVKLKDERYMDLLEIPSGKIEKGFLIGGYAYGKLEYPIARNELRSNTSDIEIYAHAVTPRGEEFPVVAMRRWGNGKVLYVNLPLGHLKGYSDDLLLRSIIRAFSFKVVKIPHLVNTYYGKGGLVINWHIDANSDWKSIPLMLKEGYLRKDIEYSIHITAGDFRDRLGDGLGFDACNKGRDYVNTIKDYGIVGSHGGWAHNWFSENIREGRFSKKEIYEYIKKNNDCLEGITGYKVTEFSAPNGVHPQPLMTEVLEGLGFIAYYYTGDTGSPPNRTFIDGKMVSEKVIAFPIMPFGKTASLHEMRKAGKREDEVKEWLIQTVDYAVRNKTVRLIYSHPYDISNYPIVLRTLLDYSETLQRENKLEIKPMSYFARFLLRFLKTEYIFKLTDNGLAVSLKNAEGLDGITVAIPRDIYKKPISNGIIIQEDGDYYYLIINENLKEKIVYIESLLRSWNAL